MTEPNPIDAIQQKLEEAFPGAQIELSSTGSMHVGHGSCGLHLKTSIVYQGFAGKNILAQHRMVHDVLRTDIGRTIHAISINTKEKK